MFKKRPSGLMSTMTSAQFQSFLSSYQGTELDLTGVEIYVNSQVLFPKRNWKIRGGTFRIGPSFVSTNAMAQIGNAVGSDNAALDVYGFYELGPIPEGTISTACTSALSPGWYHAYGAHASADRIVHALSSVDYHYYKGELVYVTSANGTSITFAEPLGTTYGTLRLSNFHRPMENVLLENVVFNGFNGTATGCSNCLSIGATIGLTIKNCQFLGYRTKGLFITFGKGVSLVDTFCQTDTPEASERYAIEIDRCTGLYARNLFVGLGRWGLTGHGSHGVFCEDSYFFRGADGDHGAGGRKIVFKNCSVNPSSGFWNIANPSWLAGSEVTLVDCIHKTNSSTVEAIVYIYPNARATFLNCQLDSLKLRTYPTGFSTVTGDPGPISVVIGPGTVLSKGVPSGYTVPGYATGNYVMQHAYNDVVDASGSKLSYFEVSEGASAFCWTFGPPISMKGVTSACTSIIRGALGVNWDNSSVPAIWINGGRHYINVSGMVLQSTKPTIPSLSTDIVRADAGVLSGTSIVLGSVTVSWAVSSVLEVAPSGRVNDSTGGKVTLSPL